MNENARPEQLAPSIEASWREAFILELRLQGASGSTLADALSEVETHCADSGESALEAFGDPVEYAGALDLPDESRWTVAQLVRTGVGLLLVVGGFSLAAWGISALFLGGDAHLTVGRLVSGGVTLTLMALMFVFTNAVVRFVVEHIVWAVVAFVVALSVTVLSGLPFDDVVLGSVPALAPLVMGVALMFAGALWFVFLKKTGRSLDDPLLPPQASAGSTETLGQR